MKKKETPSKKRKSDSLEQEDSNEVPQENNDILLTPASAASATTTLPSSTDSKYSDFSTPPLSKSKNIDYHGNLTKNSKINGILSLIEYAPEDIDKEHSIPLKAFHKIAELTEEYSKFHGQPHVTYDKNLKRFQKNSLHEAPSKTNDKEVEESYFALNQQIRNYASESAVKKGGDKTAMTFGALALALNKLDRDACNQENAKKFSDLLEKVERANLIIDSLTPPSSPISKMPASPGEHKNGSSPRKKSKIGR